VRPVSDFDVTLLDPTDLRNQRMNELLFGRRPTVKGYANQGYAGAELGGYNQNWLPIARHPDQEMTAWLMYLWARSYEQHRNNVMVYGPTEVLAEAVGEMIPTSRAKDPESRKILQDGWSEWAEQAGSDGVSSWSDICEQLVGSACQGGDVGIQFDHRPEFGGPTPLRINLIDAYRIASPLDPQNSETVRFGVAYNQGAEVGYYVTKEDGFTMNRDGFYRFDRVRNGRPNFDLFRRPDSTRRPGQSRGVPIVASILNEVKELGDYRRSTVRGAGKRSRLTTILKSPDPEQVQKFFSKVAALQAAGQIDAATALRESAKPNLVTTPDAATLNIPNYYEIQNTPPDVTDTGYGPFLDSNLQLVAGAWQLPFEVAYQIWKDASFARARILYLRQGRTATRWRKGLTRPANTAWRLNVQYILAANKKLKFSPDLYDVDWHGPTQEYQDFQKEIDAEAKGRSSGIDSPQGFARRLGRDAFVSLQETIEYVKKRKELMAQNGLTDYDMAAASGPIKEAPVNEAMKAERVP